ncbi:MAG TPA: transporter substrate-binding domain-containing protein [Vicinamibacterales bacterium]|jgi:polar amino acid transport system substrate-binding protein
MRLLVTFVVISALSVALAATQATVAPTGTLRVAYLSGNPAQAVKDPATGTIRGVAIDLARELARRHAVEASLMGMATPQDVIEAVQGGKADVGFVAYNPERAGPVEFSQPYLLVQQTFVVLQDSTIRSIADIDRPNQKIGARKGDSIALYLARTLKRAQLVNTSQTTSAEITQMLVSGQLDAFGANRQRLSDVLPEVTGLRLLPDDLYGVEQTLIVPTGKPDVLKHVNQFIEDVRRSGFLQKAIERSGVIGIAVASPPSK